MTLFPQPDPNRCDCPCHTQPGTVHLIPCCMPCQHCKRVFRTEVLGQHTKTCSHPQTVLARRTLLTVAVTIEENDDTPLGLDALLDLVERIVPSSSTRTAADMVATWIDHGDVVELSTEGNGAYAVRPEVAIELHDSSLEPLVNEANRRNLLAPPGITVYA